MRKQVTEYTCDVCGCEVDESILIPNVIEFGNHKSDLVDIEIDLEASGDVCIYCFIKAVNKLDTRPKAAN
jgi:hypothetical protein